MSFPVIGKIFKLKHYSAKSLVYLPLNILLYKLQAKAVKPESMNTLALQ